LPAPFSTLGWKSAGFGQQAAKLPINAEKFAAKLPAAGNSHLSAGPDVSLDFMSHDLGEKALNRSPAL